ncbi:hypothetical protein JCM11641_005356 [Rhodosporidiobolus odoratus]
MELASSFLSSAASSLAAAQRSTISSSFTLDASTRSTQIGVWKVTSAKHNSNGKLVSVWTAEKSTLATNGGTGTTGAGARRGGAGRSEREKDQDRLKLAIEILKKEASSLSRLRHPCVLEVTEPLEETRSSLTFATEPVTSSLRHAINASDAAASGNGRGGSYATKEEQDAALDEVEVQKGFTQLAKGLQFLHESAKLVHGNLTPDAVIINAKGDWKLSGFGLATYLFDPQGVPAKWEFPSYDPNLPPSCQRNYDYMAPEYLLDESAPAPSNDMYSLGCLLHSLHTHTGPPFNNRSSLPTARDNIEPGLSHNLLSTHWRKLPSDIQDVLSNLLTRYPNRRLSAKQFLDSAYFEGLLVGTLRFLERDSFASKSSEAQASFLRGLVTVLPQFSSKVNRRKVLPSLLEETRKANLVPFLLPNILNIAKTMDNEAFREEVLPGLKPLFAVKEPPQAVVSLLESLGTLEEKCSATVFREEVMPLVYFSLESDNPLILEKALRVTPSLCETLDYTTIKQTLFPKITSVFSKTTLLSVKVNTLICFHSMIKILDKYTLTEKLVPLLAKIKTKEPSVMIATLAVHEEMGKKCEVEAVATLILPQLWSMSVGPLLNVDQFNRFITAIKALSLRVESEHSAHLAELKRLEESSGGGSRVRRGGGGGAANNGQGEIVVGIGEVNDFETLVRGSLNGNRVEGLRGVGSQVDIFADESPASTPVPTGNAGGFSSPPLPALPTQTPPFPSSSAFAQPSRPGTLGRLSTTPLPSSSANRNSLGARPISATGFHTSSFPVSPSQQQQQQANPTSTPAASLRSFSPLQPGPSGAARTGSSTSFASAQPSSSSSSSSTYQPNYHLSLSTTASGGIPPLRPTGSSFFPSSSSTQLQQQQNQTQPPTPIQWNKIPPISPSSSTPSYSQPLRPQLQAQPARTTSPLPPGYNPSTSTSANMMAPLQPQRQKQQVGGQGGQAGSMGFGSWADLDPLK